jgi:hypothetical protein
MPIHLIIVWQLKQNYIKGFYTDIEILKWQILKDQKRKNETMR